MRKRILAFVMAFAIAFTCAPFLSGTGTASAASKPAQVKNVKMKSNGAGYVKVSWKKAKRAKKYQVYVCTTGYKGKYKKVKTVSKNSAKITGYGNNKGLWVKVRGVKGKKKGKFSYPIYVYTGDSSSSSSSSQSSSAGSVTTIQPPVGRALTVLIPSEYSYYYENEGTLTYKSNSTPLRFIGFTVTSGTQYLDTVRSSMSGSNKVVNGISGYEYTSGSTEAFFTFTDGSYCYTIDVDGQDALSILHNVLTGLALS